VTRIAHLQGVPLEYAVPLLLQPDQRRQAFLVHIGTERDERAGDDVEIAVAIEICRLCTAHAWQIGERVGGEREGAYVLEPLDAVIRLDDLVVERVAVGEEDVEVAIAVEVDDFGCLRNPSWDAAPCR
jgi:hypothetical protein